MSKLKERIKDVKPETRKAIELFDWYHDHLTNCYASSCVVFANEAKECALRAVEEILDTTSQTLSVVIDQKHQSKTHYNTFWLNVQK